MRLTSRGLVSVVAVAVLGVAGRVLGVPELLVLSITLAAAVITTGVWVGLHPIRLDVRRSIRPPRIEAGATCHVSLRVHNTGTRRSPSVELSDQVEHLGSVRVQLAGLEPDESCDAVLAFTTVRRGLLPVGPLVLVATDPFNLWRRQIRRDEPAAVLVLARTFPIGSLPTTPGDEFEQVQRAPDVGSNVDDEFNSLREYVAGDDLRMVHWPTTARTGTPMVRQFDRPWQRRTTVVVDVGADSDRHDALDRAISVAASVVAAAARGSELIRVVGSDGSDSGFVSAMAQESQLLDRLAVMGHEMEPPDGTRRRNRVMELPTVVRRASTGDGAVVVCTSRSGDLALSELARAAGWPVQDALVVCTGASAPDRDVAGTSGPVLRWDGRTGLDQVWSGAQR